MMKRLKDFFLSLFKKSKEPSPFDKELVAEEIEVQRLGDVIISVEVKGQSKYLLPTDERYCQIVFDSALGQHYIVKKVLEDMDDVNFCRVSVRILSNLEVKTLVIPKRLLNLQESK